MMETRLLFVLCVAVFGLVLAGKHDKYSRYSVYEVKIQNTTDQAVLHKLEEQLNLDFWQEGSILKRDAHIMVQPENKAAFLAALDYEGIEYNVRIEDVAESLEQNDKQRSSRSGRMIFQDYLRHAEINAYLERVARLYPNFVTIVDAMKSFEQRDIKYLKISSTNFQDTSKPIYFLTAMMHAREWVTTPVTLYSVYRLVENLRSEDKDLLQDVDWIIMPVINPDGYEYSHEEDRLWRKTRSYNPEASTTCYGVDSNRNFEPNWGTIGVIHNPCHDLYPGPHAFSEVEVQNVRDIFLEYRDRIQIYMDIHSYGEFVTYGYGDRTLPPNAVQVHQVASSMGAVIDTRKLPQSYHYLVGNSAVLMYNTSGCAQDYGQSLDIPFSLTLELPSYGYAFEVPPQYQDQINEETWHGIAISARLSKLFYQARINQATNP